MVERFFAWNSRNRRLWKDLGANISSARAFYAASTLLCVPHSLSEGPGPALGAQAGEQRLREIVTAAGFGRFRRVAETPFNLIYEAWS